MTFLIIGKREQQAITKALALARDQYMPWSIGKTIAIDDRAKPTNTLTLAERKHDNPFPRSQHLMLGNYRCAISFEEQPAGLCRHLSVSVKRRGKVPGIVVMQEIAKAFGFSGEIPPTRGRMWLEEFEPGQHAVNLIEVEVQP